MQLTLSGKRGSDSDSGSEMHSGATPLLRGCSRKNIFCQKIFDNFFSFQATWFLHQNGVESNQESKSDDSGPFYNVTERCEAVREVPKDVLKMASGLISPSGHCGQLCIG